MKRTHNIFACIIMVMNFILSCQNSDHEESKTEKKWSLKKLENRSRENSDSRKWNRQLFKQDIGIFHQYSAIFDTYPLNNYPFPVADYEYAVYSNPFTFEKDSLVFKGIQIGEYADPNSDHPTTKLTLIVLTNDDKVEPESFVDSRNYPYLTAEGNFPLSQNTYQWVFSATPDGFSCLLFSMKLFDLRFGETIIIYPQADHSFLYEQLHESPNKYSKLEDYLKRIKENKKIMKKLNS